VNRRNILPIAAVAALSLSLAGCVSLFPKAKPSQLYSFKTAVAEAAAAPKPPAVTVLRAPTAFVREASTDRILTRTGNQTAYLAEARWSSPASILFDEALSAAFDNGTVRLATRGDVGPSDAVLRVEVRTFEATYRDGAEAAPTAVVEARGTLTSLKDRTVVGTKLFRSEHKANENRTGPIVEAYDAAVGDLMNQMVRWTTETVKPANTP
jgi:cholesterol transport system auxiliary component